MVVGDSVTNRIITIILSFTTFVHVLGNLLSAMQNNKKAVEI